MFQNEFESTCTKGSAKQMIILIRCFVGKWEQKKKTSTPMKYLEHHYLEIIVVHVFNAVGSVNYAC